MILFSKSQLSTLLVQLWQSYRTAGNTVHSKAAGLGTHRSNLHYSKTILCSLIYNGAFKVVQPLTIHTKDKGLEPQGVYTTLISSPPLAIVWLGLALSRSPRRLCINCCASEKSRSQVQNRWRKAVKAWNLLAQGAGQGKGLCLEVLRALLAAQLEPDQKKKSQVRAFGLALQWR